MIRPKHSFNILASIFGLVNYTFDEICYSYVTRMYTCVLIGYSYVLVCARVVF